MTNYSLSGLNYDSGFCLRRSHDMNKAEPQAWREQCMDECVVVWMSLCSTEFTRVLPTGKLWCECFALVIKAIKLGMHLPAFMKQPFFASLCFLHLSLLFYSYVTNHLILILWKTEKSLINPELDKKDIDWPLRQQGQPGVPYLETNFQNLPERDQKSEIWTKMSKSHLAYKKPP